MRYTKLKKSCSWEPVPFHVKDIILLLEKAVMAEFVVSYHDQPYWIGVACEYDRQRQAFSDQTFYIDNQEFGSLEEFKSLAVLKGHVFSKMQDKLSVIDTQEGDPKIYLDLVAKLRKERC